MLKLHDLQVGQRFTFTDKHRGKVFEVTIKGQHHVVYMDVATKQERTAYSHREMFRKEVVLETGERVITINDRERLILQLALSDAYLKSCEEGTQDSVGVEIDQLYLKITGLPGRRVVLPNE